MQRIGERGGCSNVEPRRHAVDGLLVFLGAGPTLNALTVKVVLGRQSLILQSPRMVGLEALPRNSNGKVLRKELAAKYLAGELKP